MNPISPEISSLASIAYTALLYFVFLVGPVLILGFGLVSSVSLFVRHSLRDIGSALLSSFVTAASTGMVVWMSVVWFRSYGMVLFLGLPLFGGMLSVFLHAYHRPRTYFEAMGVASLTLILVGAIIIFFALDGLICILMASPLAFIMAFAASIAVNAVMLSRHKARTLIPVLSVCALLPFLVGFEARSNLPPPTSVVVSSIDIPAPAATVWKYIPAIPPIAAPPGLAFRAGIAYPLRSEMSGTGVGAGRLCVLSTGPLSEIVTVWEPNRLLRFDVISCPPSMREMSIYADLHPAHLDNFMVSEWGQFRLIPLDATHTRVEGTSQYHNRMWPACYWLPISDWVVRQIHDRVLDHIKDLAEKDQGQAAFSK